MASGIMLFDSFFVVAGQVLVLFILIAIGYFFGKLKILNDGGIKCINDVLMYLVVPCVIINIFQREFTPELLVSLLRCMLAALLAHVLSFVLIFFFIRKEEENKKRVLRFAAIFCNCGYMALPLIEAMLGTEGLFFGAGYLAIFNLLAWSFGRYDMASGQEKLSFKSAFINPGIIATIVGIILFVCSIRLPDVLHSPIASLAALNTPVPMLIIGYTISTFNIKKLFELRDIYSAVIVRLLLTPLILLGILYAVGFRGAELLTIMISASTPSGAFTTMFAIKYGNDVETASRIVSVTTVFSMITMTVIVGLSRFLAYM